MLLRPAALLASFALLAAVAAPPLAAAELTIPPIPYHQRTLPNGLQVLSVEPQGQGLFCHIARRSLLSCPALFALNLLARCIT